LNCKRTPAPALRLVLVLLAAAGCGERVVYDDREAGIPVVDAILLVGRPLPSVFLSRALAPDIAYDSAQAALAGAQLTVTRGSASFVYVEHPDTSGRYDPVAPEAVQPNARYALRAVLPGGAELAAVTTTPAAFEVTDWLLLDPETLAIRRDFLTFEEAGDSVFTAPENQIVYLDGLLEARFAPPDGAGRYQVGIRSLDENSPFVIDADFLDEEDYEDFERNVGSPALEATDGFVRLPWFAIFFAGRHKIDVFSVDENWFDLVRSAPEVIGGAGPAVGGNAGDGFERPIFHVEGGIGLFGSASVDSIGFVILPRE
jgi:hypothetical protein